VKDGARRSGGSSGSDGREDLISNPYVVRDYGDYYLVLLRSNVAREDDEGDPFYFSMGSAVT